MLSYSIDVASIYATPESVPKSLDVRNASKNCLSTAAHVKDNCRQANSKLLELNPGYKVFVCWNILVDVISKL